MKNILILTGAGISAESGLTTFRDANGLWENYRVEDVASIEGFEKNPNLVHDFYNRLRPLMDNAKPNAAHLAIAELQQKRSDLNINVVTQNVDLLHEKANTQNIYHMHGRIDECVCMNCKHVMKISKSVLPDTPCKFCFKTGTLKPNIVFFGEMPMFMTEISNMIKSCDTFIAIGTSGIVYPAAGFVQEAKYFGSKTYIFNLEKIENNYYFDYEFLGKASETLPKFFKECIQSS